MSQGETPNLRRSTRHQPQVGIRLDTSADWTHQWAGDYWHVRPTKLKDLHKDEESVLPTSKISGSGENQEISFMETLFYQAFLRNRVVRPSKGKGKAKQDGAQPELFKIGDTILIHSHNRNAPNVAVIVGLWETRMTQDEPVNGVKFESMKVRVHWFIRPGQTAKVCARRDHLKNEIYFSLRENATLAPADVIGHCEVSSNRPDPSNPPSLFKRSPVKNRSRVYDDDSDSQPVEPAPNVFFCGLALDASQGDYSKFTWEQQRDAMIRKGPQEHDTLWHIEIDKKPKKLKEDVAESSGGEDTDSYSQASDESQDSVTHEDEIITGDEVSTVANDSDTQYEATSPSRKRKRSKAGIPPTNTKRKRIKRAVPKASNVALRAGRKARGRLSALKVAPSLAATTNAQLRNLPQDPLLRVMHVLHVGARPDALPCRDDEYMEVMGAVLGLVEEGSGGCVYISGVPGTGKTATVHAVVRELKRMAERGETNPFTYVEINGLKIPEPSAAYALLWEAVSGHDVASEGRLEISAKEALKMLNYYFGAGVRAGPGGHACVVLMDELDQLVTPKQEVIYNFFNWPSLASSKLIVIAVANTHDLPERVMSGKVRSRLGMVRINFHPYDRGQLQQIVQARLESAREGLHKDAKLDVFEPDAVKFVAMKVSSVSGDARRILDICRRSVELMRSTKVKMVQIPHVQQVLDAMQNSPTAAYLQDCSLHERIMLASLLKCIKREGVDEIRWGDVQHQHRNYINILTGEDDPRRKPSDVELARVLDSLVASRAVIIEEGVMATRKHQGDRKVVLNIESGEVERVLSGVGGTIWKNALGI